MRVLVFFLSIVVVTSAQAGISSLTVDPAWPSETDTVTVTVEGIFYDGCWSVQGVEFDNSNPVFTFTAFAYDYWTPGQGCPMMLVEYTRTEQLVSLPAGLYEVRAYEQVSSQRSDGDYASVVFAVGDCCTTGGNVDGRSSGGVPCNMSDITFLVDYLFNSGSTPPCPPEGDADASGSVNVSDLSYLVNYLFKSGPPPLCPM